MGGASSDVFGGLETALGVGLLALGNPVGAAFIGQGAGTLASGGQNQPANPLAAATGGAIPGAGGQPSAQNTQLAANQVGSATQQILQSLGMNPQQRPQGAPSPNQMMQQPPPMSRGGQQLGIPQLPSGPEAAGVQVAAGSGSMPGQNPNLTQILGMLGRPYMG